MADLTRRRLLATTGRALTAAALGGLAARGAWLAFGGNTDDTDVPPVLDRELRVGHLPITDAAALLAAHEGGYWRQAGLPSAKPVLFRSWESLAQAFVVGEVDVVHLLMPFAVQLRAQTGAPVRIVAWGHTNGSTLTVAPSITDTEQLAGTRVAIPYWWSIHSMLTQRMLDQAGLTPVVRQPASASAGTVELVVMAPAEMVAALAANSISGFTVADPFSAVVEAQQIGHVHRFLGDVWRDHACCGIAIRQEFIDTNPEAVQALADGLIQAQQWLDGHRTEAGAMLTSAGYLPQPEPAVTKVFTRTPEAYTAITRHFDWHGERLGFTAFPHPDYTAELVTAMKTTVVDGDTSFLNDLDPGTVHGDLFDNRFVVEALRRARLPVPTPRQEQIA